ncbi:MAG: hypothetical protein GWN14_19045, partial [candidate division Zixibacteria bacterium]|nr:hypothetical protein [Gammaproteobacteria bacterium]NIX57957.1 hypothetical protein [candidate division Zixibacteria bacterium]
YTELVSPRYVTIGYDDALAFIYDFARGAIYYYWPDGSFGLLTNGIFSVRQIVYNNSTNRLLAISGVDNLVYLAGFPRGGPDQYEVPAEDLVTAAGVSPDG